MVSPSDDLDLTQAQAFALQASELAELLQTVADSLTASLARLNPVPDSVADLESDLTADLTADPSGLHQTLHDLKGYLGLVASATLCQQVRLADEAARHGHENEALSLLTPLIPRLQALEASVRDYRAGIIDG